MTSIERVVAEYPWTDAGYWDASSGRGRLPRADIPRPFDIRMGQAILKDFNRFPLISNAGETAPHGYNLHIANLAPGTVLKYDHEMFVGPANEAFSNEARALLANRTPRYDYHKFEQVEIGPDQETGFYLRRVSTGVVLPTPGPTKVGFFSYAYKDPQTYAKPDLFRVDFYHNPLIVGEGVHSKTARSSNYERLLALEIHENMAQSWDYYQKEFLKSAKGRLLNWMI